MNLAAIISILGQAAQILNIFHVLRKSADPAANTAGVDHVAALIGVVSPLVQTAEAISATGVTQGSAPLTGVEKLAIVQSGVKSAHNAALASGATNDTFEAVWAQVNPVITEICAANKQPSGANNLNEILGV